MFYKFNKIQGLGQGKFLEKWSGRIRNNTRIIEFKFGKNIPNCNKNYTANGNTDSLATTPCSDSAVTLFKFRVFVGFDGALAT